MRTTTVSGGGGQGSIGFGRGRSRKGQRGGERMSNEKKKMQIEVKWEFRIKSEDKIIFSQLLLDDLMKITCNGG